jgi:acetyl-CoA acetyltransferase
MTESALIVGAGQAPYVRHPDAEATTERLLACAMLRALSSAGIKLKDVDGLGVSSFTLAPDHVADLTWRFGLRVRWLMDDGNGGASGVNMLQHAKRAVESGDARTIVLVAGDRFDRASFQQLVDTYNQNTVDYLAPIPIRGPNTLFAMLTSRQMELYGLVREDYGQVVLAQRRWASLNPAAVYREPLTMAAYLNAPVVADPLHRYDCPPVVSGADAIVVSSGGSRGVAVRSLKGLHNSDGQEGDGLRTGVADIAGELWDEAGFGPEDLDATFVYDDYPAMVLAQLNDLGLVPGGDLLRYTRESVDKPPLNTSGGQLSAGQAGAGGGMHGLVEAVTQLLGHAGARQVHRVKRVVVTGYGMVLYRHGACSNAAVLERA